MNRTLRVFGSAATLALVAAAFAQPTSQPEDGSIACAAETAWLADALTIYERRNAMVMIPFEDAATTTFSEAGLRFAACVHESYPDAP